jgi:Zn-dependent protease
MTDGITPSPDEAVHPKESRIQGRIYLFQVAGIKVTLHYSWLIIFVLVVWGLAEGYFPRSFPDYSRQAYWIAGLVASLFFFASILLHELSHSVVAKSCGLEIPEITLFIFGGVAHLGEEPAKPWDELKISIAGPIASIVLALIFGGVYFLIGEGGPVIARSIFEYLAIINIALAVFNLVPGYPLDGGRIFRALAWWKTGSLTKATRWASDVGKGFAWALMILGVFQIFAGALVGGLWLVLIGMFLKGIAASGYQETLMKQTLEDVSVGNVMVTDVVSISPDVTLEEAAQDYFLRYGHGGFPVVEGGRPAGLIALANIKDVPPEERPSKTVRDVMIPLDGKLEIKKDDSLIDALRQMTELGVGRLLVIRGSELEGIVTKTGLMRYFEIKQVLAKQ